jgi:hypothetical protein
MNDGFRLAAIQITNEIVSDRHTPVVHELICGKVVNACYCPKAKIARNPVIVEKTHGRLLYFDAHNHRH